MYNQEKGIWVSAEYELREKNWCRNPENREDPKALFMLADMQLADIRDGTDNANGVYWMEKSAKADYVPAMLAMGDMFFYGIAVKQNLKIAIEWYKKAADKGDLRAIEILNGLKKKRKNKTILWISCISAIIIAVVVAIILSTSGKETKEIIVHKDTELIESTTQEEFVSNLQNLLDEHDTEAVISGKVSTNRLMLKFEGSGIDLSAFPAATVISSDDNYLIIQFESEEEAQKCLEALKNIENVLFVEEDKYCSGDFTKGNTGKATATSNIGYLSWGAEFMHMDDLVQWASKQKTTPVIVAVLDSGTVAAPEYKGRVLDGINFIESGSGQFDNNGHGTHVGSIILDCTQKMDVSVLPIRVLSENGYGTTSQIVEGIKYANSSDANILNLSLGGKCNYTPVGESCGSAEDYYLSEAISKGKIVVVAAGNEKSDTIGYCPAHIEDVIVVSACDENGNYTDFTNYGDSVDVCAPGKGIVNYGLNLELYSYDGTSQAAPHISALMAILRSYMPDKTVSQLTDYIKIYSICKGNPMFYGNGIPDAAYFAGE